MTKFAAETRSVHHVLNLQSASFVFQPPSSTPNPFPSHQRNLCYTPCTIHVYLVCSCLIFIFVLVILLVLVVALWSSFGHLLPSSYSSSSFLLVWPYPLPIVIFILVLFLLLVLSDPPQLRTGMKTRMSSSWVCDLVWDRSPSDSYLHLQHHPFP